MKIFLPKTQTTKIQEQSQNRKQSPKLLNKEETEAYNLKNDLQQINHERNIPIIKNQQGFTLK